MQQDNPNQSALLRCLSRLDVDTWAQVLLPKLISQGSAADVTLTCSQLRDLCFGAVQHINLSSVHDDELGTLEDFVLSIPQHFQSVTSVQLLLNDDGSYHTIPYLLPELARLPKLELVRLSVQGDPRPAPMGTVLHSLRTQLAGSMRSLHLDLQQSWAGAAQVWGKLGKYSGVTKLVLDLDDRVAEPFHQQDLLPLAKLHSLEDLALVSHHQTFYQPLLSAELAAGLTGLTRLALDACLVSCLTHVSSCVSLKVLQLGCPDGMEKELRQIEWSAVGELTGLVELTLHNAHFLTPTQECRAAVSKLTNLHTLGAYVWSVEMLPLLAACTKLSKLYGGWQEPVNSNSVGHITLPSVVGLFGTFGSPPFASLPNLITVEQWDCLTTDAFINMARHCTRLGQLKTGSVVTSFPSGGGARACISAIKALSALTCVTHLEFSPGSSAELIALVDAVHALLPKGFRHLQLLVRRHSPMQLIALMHLARLQGLPELQLLFDDATADDMVREASTFLSGLGGIRVVGITGLKQAHVGLLKSVHEALQQLGLPRPTSFHAGDMGRDLS